MLFALKFTLHLMQMAKKNWERRYQREKGLQIYREFEDSTREDLIDYILRLRAELAEISQTANNEPNSSEKQLSERDYKQKWSYPTKITFLLTISKKPLNSEELEKLLLQYDTHFKDYDKPRNNLTVTLNRAVKSRRIEKFKVPGIRTLYYALPEWIDKEGKLKPAFAVQIDFFK